MYLYFYTEAQLSMLRTLGSTHNPIDIRSQDSGDDGIRNVLDETAVVVSDNSNEDAVNTSSVPVEIDETLLIESAVGDPAGDTDLDEAAGETDLDETLQASNLDETVELTVNISPPRRVLRSHSAKQNLVKSTSKKAKKKKRGKQTVSKETAASPPTPPTTTDSLPRRRRGVRSRPRNATPVQNTSPVKRSIRGDGVNQRCRVLKVKYKKYEGDTSPKPTLHLSQFKYKTKVMIPQRQQIPGECVLCPQQKLLINDRDKTTHYDTVHISKLIVVGNTTSLYCKCSVIRSQGADQMTRNLHYHCPVCHWPHDTWQQMGQHIYSKHKNIPYTDYSHLLL